MSEVSFIVVGEPVGKERPRHNGRHVYTPPRTVRYEEEVGRAFAAASPLTLEQTSRYTGPVALRVREYRRVPVSWPQWKQREARSHKLVPLTTPDADNVIKSIKDGLSANERKGILGAYANDSQVTRIDYERAFVYGMSDNTSYVSVVVTYLEEVED